MAALITDVSRRNRDLVRHLLLDRGVIGIDHRHRENAGTGLTLTPIGQGVVPSGLTTTGCKGSGPSARENTPLKVFGLFTL